MQLLQTPTHEVPEFDRLCDGLEEFEPLPDGPSARWREPDDDERLNEEILAGLISPV